MWAKFNAFIWEWMDDVIILGASGAAGIGTYHWVGSGDNLAVGLAGIAGYLVAVVYNRASKK